MTMPAFRAMLEQFGHSDAEALTLRRAALVANVLALLRVGRIRVLELSSRSQNLPRASWRSVVEWAKGHYDLGVATLRTLS